MNKIKQIFLSLVIFSNILFANTLALTQIDNLTKKEINYLINKKVVNMCIDPDWMPFEKLDKNGKHVGMTADYFKIFQKHLGIEIKVIRTKSWSQ